MLRNYRFVLLAMLVTVLVFNLCPVSAETNSPTLEEMEAEMWENFTLPALDEFLDICAEQKGVKFAREKAKFYSSLYPDEFYPALYILRYCDPFDELEESIEAAQKIIRMIDLPAHVEGTNYFLHDGEVVNCASAHLMCVYAYYELGDEDQLVKHADWLASYAGYDEDQFMSALSAYDYVTLHFVHSGNDEKALHYARQVEELLRKYGEQYPKRVEEFMPEYEVTFVSILEKQESNNAQQEE